MTLDEILGRFRHTSENNGQYRADCPVCGDTHQHLYIKEADGKILFDCKKGCDFDRIIEAAGLRPQDCFIDKRPASPRKAFDREHLYDDGNGNIIAKKVVYNASEGKTCSWFRCENGKYTKGLQGIKAPLYHLTKLRRSAAADIIIVEGEKDVETVEKLGFTSTTSPNGAGSRWPKDYNVCFSGKNVCIIMDNDEPGEKYGMAAAKSIYGTAKAIKLIRAADIYPNIQAKGDISDIAELVGLDKTKELLYAAVKKAGIYPEGASVSTPAEEPIKKISLKSHNLSVETAAETDELIDAQLRKLKPETLFSFNDKGNGELFAEVFKDICRYNVSAKEWYVYKDGYWQQDTGNMIVMRYAKKLHTSLVHYAAGVENESVQKAFLENVTRLARRSFRETMLKDAQDAHFIRAEDMDRNEWLFNCKNGTYDLRGGYFRKHSSGDLISKMSNVYYDPNASSAEFETFINSVMCGNPNKINFLKKAFGYSLTGDTSQECMFILYGATSRNGKGTLMETISHMMGGEHGYSMAIQPETLAGRKNKDSRQASGDIARLKGARLLNASEPEKSMVFDAALLKTMTGRDTITARHLHEREMQFTPSFKLFINTNYLPHVNDNTLFLSDRIRVVTFDRHFSEEERDLKLKDRLKQPENISGLFNWCIEGLEAYVRTGLIPPEDVICATKKYQQSSDRQIMFINECLEEDSMCNCRVSSAFLVYRDWCRANGYLPENKTNFMAGLRNKNLVSDTGTAEGVTYHNVIHGYRISDEYKRYDESGQDQSYTEDLPL